MCVCVRVCVCVGCICMCVNVWVFLLVLVYLRVSELRLKLFYEIKGSIHFSYPNFYRGNASFKVFSSLSRYFLLICSYFTIYSDILRAKCFIYKALYFEKEASL